MKVILLQDVKSLGKKDDIVEVSDGYARNYIIPQKKGVQATSENMNNLKLARANREKVAKEQYEAALALGAKIESEPVVIRLKLGAGGKLFGAISTKEISQMLKTQRDIDVDKKKIVLAEPIKELGTHEVKIKLHRDVSCTLKVKVEEA